MPLPLPFDSQPEREASGPTIVVHDPEPSASARPAVNIPRLALEPDIHQPSLVEEWSSMSQDDSDQEPTTTSTSRSGSPVSGLVMPETIEYTLKITFEKEEVPLTQNRGLIRLNDASDYQKFEKVAEDCVKEHYMSALAGKSLNFRNGDCSIIGDNNYKQVHGLSSQEDWRDIHTILVNYWTSSRHKHQRLDITRDYFGLLIRKKSDETFASSKGLEMDRLMKEAFDGRHYIPRTDLIRITSADMIREIILEDPIPEFNRSEHDVFVHKVLKDAPKLLAACVYTELRMGCLKHLLDAGHNDNTLSVRPLDNKDRCHDKCGRRFKNLVSVQGGFYTAEFWKAGEHKKLHRCTVVPVQFHPQEEQDNGLRHERSDMNLEIEANKPDDEEVTPLQRRAYCGSGAFSKVYRVRLDPEHHRLSKVSHGTTHRCRNSAHHYSG